MGLVLRPHGFNWELLATADLHFGNSHGAGTINRVGINSFLVVRERVFKEMIERASREGCPIVVAGDLFDSAVLDPVTMQSFHRCLQHAVNLEVQMLVLGGNHEFNGLHSLMGSYSQLNLSGIRFVYRAEVVKIKRMKFYCVPYAGKTVEQEYKMVLRFINKAKQDGYSGVKILLLHYPIIGCKYDSGSIVHTGFNLKALLDEAGNPFDMILAGDFHDRQRLSGVSNFLYLGQPYWSDFASVGKRRGYTLFNFSTNRRQLVIPGDCPRFVVLNNISKVSDISGDLGNTIVKASIDRNLSARKVYERCYELGALKVMIRREPKASNERDSKVVYRHNVDKRDAIARFAKDNKPKGIGLKRLIKTATNVLKEVGEGK